MNRTTLNLGILTAAFMLVSCINSGATKEIAVEQAAESDKYAELNQKVRKANNIQTPVELIKYYYGEMDDDQDIEISVEQIKTDQYEITLIQNNIKDDSIAGMKIIMIAEFQNSQWTVLDIQRTWKCQRWRGHSKFSSKPCN